MPYISMDNMGWEDLRIYIKLLPQAALVVDEKGKILTGNEVLLEVLRISHDKLTSLNFMDFILEASDFEQWRKCYSITHKYTFCVPGDGRKQGRTPDNRRKTQIFTARIKDLHPYDSLFLLILLDISRSQLTDLKNHFLQMLTKEPNLGMILVDREARIILISDMVCRLLGVKREEVLNQSMELVFPNLPDERRHLLTTLHEGVVYRNQAITWKVEDKRYELLVDTNLVRSETGEIEGAFMMFKDVTNLRSLEEQIKRNDRLSMIGQIAAGTAHEIRNPLTSIKGFLQMLQHSMEEQGLEREKSYTEIMLTELERINHLVSEFLLLSKPRDAVYKPTNVVQVLRELLPIIETECHLHNVLIRTHYPENVPLVVADSELLKQVLLNVTKNGIEAMESGGVLTISIRVDVLQEVLTIDVHDTGPGIPPYVMDKIFDPFFTTKENGTGLGLPVCQKIIHDMGGNISLSSKGFGTTFYIQLPYIRS